MKTKTVAFFFIGESTDIPSLLVKSFNKIKDKNSSIIQLSNYETPKIEGVTEVKRFNLSKDIMIARLQAYQMYEPQAEETFFCDADGLFINQITLPDNGTLFLTKRIYDPFVNFNYPEFYPEFIEKTFNQVMPFLFGAIGARGDQSQIFKILLDICNKLPDRFHRWYGDQYSLHIATSKKKFDYCLLDQDKFLNILPSPQSILEIENLRNKGVQFITYKGPKSKIFLFETFKNL